VKPHSQTETRTTMASIGTEDLQSQIMLSEFRSKGSFGRDTFTALNVVLGSSTTRVSQWKMRIGFQLTSKLELEESTSRWELLGICWTQVSETFMLPSAIHAFSLPASCKSVPCSIPKLNSTNAPDAFLIQPVRTPGRCHSYR